MLTTLVYIILVLAEFALITAILLQDGKGGDIGDALGSAGQEAIGTGSTGLQYFTASAAALFLLSTVGIHVLNRM